MQMFTSEVFTIFTIVQLFKNRHSYVGLYMTKILIDFTRAKKWWKYIILQRKQLLLKASRRTYRKSQHAFQLSKKYI